MSENDWITPQEASLEVSIRLGRLVTSDDLRQLKRTGKIPEEYTKHFSRQITLYQRDYILRELPAPTPKVTKGAKEIDVNHVVFWLENYGPSVDALLKKGFTIKCLEDARKEVRNREERKRQSKAS